MHEQSAVLKICLWMSLAHLRNLLKEFSVWQDWHSHLPEGAGQSGEALEVSECSINQGNSTVK